MREYLNSNIEGAFGAIPEPQNILAGSSTSVGTIITVPANCTWQGTIQITGTLTVGLGTALTNANARVTWSPGTGGTPAYTVGQVDLGTPVIAALSLIGGSTSGSVSLYKVVLYAGSTAGILALANTNTTQFFASANGFIVKSL